MTFDHNDLFLAYRDGWIEGRTDGRSYDDLEDFESAIRPEFEDWFRNQHG